MLVLLGLFPGPECLAQTEYERVVMLSKIWAEVNAVLHKIDTDLASASEKLSKTGLESAAAREVLRGICVSNPYVVDCATVDKDGVMRIIEPTKYRKYEGKDISEQEQVRLLRETRQPVISGSIQTVEGIVAVDLQHPVFSPGGDFIGAVSAIIKPESLLSTVIAPAIKGSAFEVWAMDTNGTILFDQDGEEVGKVLFEDPLYQGYPDLVAMGKRVTKESDGSGAYVFYKKGMMKVVRKEAQWTTVGIHGIEWRVIVVSVKELAPSE